MKESSNHTQDHMFFLPVDSRRIFVHCRKPMQLLKSSHYVILVSPFAEEMNKSRRMFSLLSSALANCGMTTVLPDMYGTGDSEGEFADASWTIWQQDFNAVVDWIVTQNAGRLSIVAVRSGALLAASCIQSSPLTVDQIVLWQPVVSGEHFMNQFLRLRLAAGLFGGGAKKETAKELKQSLAKGELLEIAGYELSPELFSGIVSQNLAKLITPGAPPIHWIELSRSSDQSISLPSRKVIQEWVSKDIDVKSTALCGEQFWSLQEINVVPDLIDNTVTILNGQY